MNPEHPTPSAPPTSLIYAYPTIVERLPLEQLFQTPRPLEVELGAGDGSFLTQYAAAHRDRNLIGVERLLGRIRKIDKRGRRAGLDNLRLVRIEAAYFLEFLLPHHTASAIHVYFPDPWPKRKHWRHRLINARFTEVAAKALVHGGIVHLRTDNAPYFAQMVEVFGSSPLFQEASTPESLSAIQTDFERTFLAQGISTNRAAYQLK